MLLLYIRIYDLAEKTVQIKLTTIYNREIKSTKRGEPLTVTPFHDYIKAVVKICASVKQ